MSPELLEDVLVELRPVPDAEWAQEMDRRVARGFREEAPAARRAKQRWWQRTWAAPAFGTAMCALLIALVVAVPGSDDTDSGGSVADVAVESGDGGGSTAAGGAAEPQFDRESAGRSTGDMALPGPGPGSPTVPGPNRKVEYMATLTLTAPPEDLAAVGDRVLRVTDRMGGYVASSSVSSSDDAGAGSFELKVPVGRLDEAMGELSKLAHVSARSQSTQDITGSFRSARSRLREARTERESLLRQLAAADTVNETASIRRRLDLVAGQISNAKRELGSVKRRASYATISVSLTSDADAVVGEDDDGQWTPGDAIGDAGRILEVAAGVLVVALAAALPIALVLALAALAARAVVRRRREQALDAA